jgi:hypothetical protein
MRSAAAMLAVLNGSRAKHDGDKVGRFLLIVRSTSMERSL